MRDATGARGLLCSQVAVVTGAGRGIGAGIARRFAEHGADVVIADLDLEAARRTADSIEADVGGTALAARLDVSDEDATRDVFAVWAERFGRIDTVVANAGVLHLAPAVEIPVAEWRRVLDVNLTGAFLTATAAAATMMADGSGGSIVFTSSLFGVRGGRENAAYSASKFGMIGLAQSLAAELAAHGIRVNSVCPGQVQTEMMDQLVTDRAGRLGVPVDAVEAELISRVPMGRMASVAEVADVFVFLASPLSNYMTGQALVVDGGWQVS